MAILPEACTSKSWNVHPSIHPGSIILTATARYLPAKLMVSSWGIFFLAWSRRYCWLSISTTRLAPLTNAQWAAVMPTAVAETARPHQQQAGAAHHVASCLGKVNSRQQVEVRCCTRGPACQFQGQLLPAAHCPARY